MVVFFIFDRFVYGYRTFVLRDFYKNVILN